MLRRLFGPRKGTRYYGPVAYCADYALVQRPGFYALTDDGKALRRPLLRLVCVDDAPGDASNGACHYEVAAKSDPIAKAGRPVEMRANLNGKAGVSQ